MIIVRVPASSANLGPGFDVLAMALDLHAYVAVLDDGDEPPERGQAADEHHPATVAYRRAGGQGELWVWAPIPPGRGLGFSGAVHVGGAAVAAVQQQGKAALGDPNVRAGILADVTELEGHADNVAASLVGGVVATAGDHVVRVPLGFAPEIVVWIPSSTTSTDRSRAALPESVAFADAVFNVGRASLLVAALASGSWSALDEATADRLHQGARLEAAPASRAALDAGRAAGATAGWLSGSGPTVAFACEPGFGHTLVDRLAPVAEAHGATARARVLHIDEVGATLTPSFPAAPR